jgi:transposase
VVAEKKHRQFVAVTIDHTNHRVVDVLESRGKAPVLQYLRKGQASGLFAHVREVTTAMWDAYGEATREVFGDAVAIVIDRFQVMKNFQEQLTAARRELQRALPAEEARALKGSRWLWLTNPENLEEEQLQQLTALRAQFPPLAQLADHREALRQIFDDATLTTPAAGATQLAQWNASARALGLTAVNKFCDPLERWQDKIVNYFLSRASNGLTEGFNNGLRTLLRRAYGMTNFRRFRLRVLDRFGHPQPQEST